MAITITGGTGNDKFLFESDGTNLTYTNAADGSVKTAPNYGSAYLNFSQGSNDTLYFDGTGAVNVSAATGAKSLTFVGGDFNDGEENVVILDNTDLSAVNIAGSSNGLSIYGTNDGYGTISLSSVKGSVELGSSRNTNFYNIGKFNDGNLVISATNPITRINTISGGITSIVTSTGVSATTIDLLEAGQLYIQNSSGIALNAYTVTGGSIDTHIKSGVSNRMNLGRFSDGYANVKINDGAIAYIPTTITGGAAVFESEYGDYVRLSSGTTTSDSFTIGYYDENLEISSGSNNTIKASSVGGDIRFLGLKQDLTLDRIDLNLDKDGKPVETTSINNNAGMFVYSDYSSNYINSLNIGDIKDDAIFKLIVKPSKGDSYDGLILKKGTSFKADVSHSNKMTLISDDDAPFNIIGECKAGNFSICGSAYNDYFKLDNDGNADYVTVLGGDGSDVFDFTNTINKQNVIIPNFGFETTSDGSFSPSNNADVFVIKSFDPSELAVFRFTSVELIYYNTHIRMGNSSDQYYIHLATPDNTADTRCYQVTSSGLVYVGENHGSLIAATGGTPQTITAVGGRDTLDGGTNAGVNDTLVSAGKYRNTTFALHKGGGDNVAQNFDFGAEKGRNDVVAVDTSYSTFKLITPESGKVMIGSESEGSLTLEGTAAQNEFIYDYGGNIGIASVDMSSDSKYMKFVKEANFHIGQGEKTTLVFTSADSIESGVAGNQKGLGWATPYISEGLGTIDASAGHVGAVLGSNDLDQTIIVSKSKDFDEVWGGGGLDVGFSNGTNDTIVGSGNGNTVYYVGHKMGNDVLQNATAGDKVVFIDTKTTDIDSFKGTSKEFSASFKNGTTIKLSAAEDITLSNTITVQFDDVTYNWNGSNLTARN